MARYNASVYSPRPPGEVFAYLSDFSTTAEWDPGVVEAERLTSVVKPQTAELDDLRRIATHSLMRGEAETLASPHLQPDPRPDQRRDWPPSTRSLSSAKQWWRARGLAQPAKQRGPDDWQKPRLAERPGQVRVGVAWLLVANAGRGASAQADLVGGVFGLRHGEFATGFGRELFDQPRF